MPSQQCRRIAQDLRTKMETLATLGVALGEVAGNPKPSHVIASEVDGVIRALDPDLLVGISGKEAEEIRAGIVSFFRQSLDLLENPDRDQSWGHNDPKTLEAQGRGSAVYADMFTSFAASHPEWKAYLEKQGVFLDVGCGVGHISLAMANQWPQTKIVGIDVMDLALELAERNRIGSNASDRVTFRKQAFQDLADDAIYCGAFVAGAFIPTEAVQAGIRAVFRALEPGGWLFYGLYRSAPDELSRAVTAVRLARSGGCYWVTEEIESLLVDAGFSNLKRVENESVAMFVAGQKPAN